MAGDVVTIHVDGGDNPNLDTYLTLLGPRSDDPLAQDDDSGRGLSAMITDFALPVSGLYTIEVDSLSGAGTFELSLERE